MEIKQYGQILLRWAWLILIGTALAAGVAFVTSRLIEPTYAASATLLVNQAPSDKIDYTSILTSERLARTYAELLTKRPVLDEVITKLKLNITAERLAAKITVKLIRDTQLVQLQVEDENPALAATIANTIPAIFIRQNEDFQTGRYASSKASLTQEIDSINKQIQQAQEAINRRSTVGATQDAETLRMQTEMSQLRQSYTSLLQSFEAIRLAEAQSTSNVLVVEPAITPLRPVRPNILLNTALAAVVGLMLTIGAVFLLEYIDDSVRSPEQISQSLQTPVIGMIAKTTFSEKKGPDTLITVREPRSLVSEAFRLLRTNVRFAGVDNPIRVLLITSPGPSEGKSTISANLAVAMAQAGMRVLLMEGDLRRPSVHKIFTRNNRNGLTDIVLQPSSKWDAAPQVTDIPNLSILPSGPLPPNPAELLGSERMSQILMRFKSTFDVVVIDSPPMLAVTDALILSRLVDGVLFVLETSRTRTGAALQAQEQLSRAGARLIGLIMNKLPTGRGGYYNYDYYYYRHEYTSEKKPKEGWADGVAATTTSAAPSSASDTSTGR